MKIGPTILHNFGPFPHVEFDLSKRGLTGIEGIMHGRPGCSSNGSGKTKLIGGISWVLFDDPMCSGWSKDDVIRLLFKPIAGNQLEVLTDARGQNVRPEDGCYGIVHVVEAAVPIRVERYRAHPEFGNRARLIVDGEDVTRGRDSMTNAAIEDALGINYRAFASSVAFGVREDVKSFFAAADTERKNILDKILGMGIYAEAQKRARSELRALSTELEEGRRKQESIQGRLEEAEATRESLLGSDDLEALQFAWKHARMLRVLAEKELERAARAVEQAEADLEEERKAASALMQVHAVAVEAVRQERRRMEDRRRSLDGGRADHAADARRAQQEVSRWAKLGGATCAACGQTVGRDTALRSQRTALSRRDKAREAEKAALAALADLDASLEALSEPEAQRLWMVEAEESVLQGARERRVEQAEAVAEAKREEESSRRDLGRVAGQRETIEKRVAELRSELEAAKTEDAERQARADNLEFWVEGFGPKGIRSFLIESEIPEINRVATRYARRLLGAGAEVRLGATRQLRSGETREEMAVIATIPGCTLTYAGASKGQRKRLDLSLLLAFREIGSRRFGKSFDQLFADELFDGLDEAGEEAVVELLREISATCPVTLVTHSDVLKAAADRLLTVHHENGVATLEAAP